MNVEAFIRTVRAEFDFLFEHYGFQLVHCCRLRLRPEYILLGLTSSQCRLVFEQEEDEFAVLIGTRDAIFGDNQTINPLRQWFSVDWMHEFRVDQQADQNVLNEVDDDQPPLRLYARLLAQSGTSLFALFDSPATVAQWHPAYEHFLHSRLGLAAHRV
jgi:hypothetical protein